MYLVARQGALNRFRDHTRVPRGQLDRHFDNYDKAITVLIPSYAEEPAIVRYTMWSAALQEFPSLNVVLLIDDNPNPTDPTTLERLNETRALADEIVDTLAEPAAHFRAGYEQWLADRPRSTTPEHAETVAGYYREAAEWLETMAEREAITDHVAEFFATQVLMNLASDLRLNLLALNAAVELGESPDAERISELYRRLVWIFTASAFTFERKRYASLSQEANKAMNLNSYISLMGGSYNIEHTAGGDILVEHDERNPEPAELTFPDTEYLLTLDADSQLLRDYCIRLVYLLEQPENENVAVTQTPYSSFRGAPTRIERIAGATTDLQHILHQGMTYYGATFWVGANAVIRKRALLDIAETQTVGGFVINTYIQDRTVIEDTESSVDLGTHGWTLVNYPERLSYSATPPDFGSLIVQRRRWANGGLIIMPKLLQQIRARRRTDDRMRMGERLLRVNYLMSIAWASFGLLFLLFYPYDSRLLSPLVFIAALPYFLAMGSDLRDCGHRFSDIFRIYGFNLVLLPVNLAGVFKSFQQALTSEKIPFARTPKVSDRTASPAWFVLMPVLIVAFSLLTLWRDATIGHWGNAAFAAFNAVLATWAIYSYIGVKNSVVDFVLGIENWLYVDAKPKPSAQNGDITVEGVAATPAVQWESILYHGDRRLNRDLRRTSDRRRRLTKTSK
ncbi:glycosyltransferase family 2 protein [Lysinibacter cavernae]|nr:glycosyltransferase family 2 protein [Lysinibacter cavernae]